MSRVPWVIVYWLGVALHRAHLYAPAASLLRRVIAARPDDYSARWYLAWTEFQRGRFDEAIAQFYELLSKWQGDVDLYAALGEALQARNRHEEAIEALSKALGARPDDVSSRYGLARSYAALSDFELAIATYRAILEENPGHAHALGNLGVALGHAGRWEESAECCRRAVELEPSPVHVYNLGIALAELGDLAEAERVFRRAVELRPSDRDFRMRLAMVLSQRERVDEAVILFTHSPLSAEANCAGLADLVGFLLQTERFAEALRTAQSAAERYPDLAPAYTALGSALLLSDRFSEALASFERALTLDAANADALAGRAASRSLLGEHRGSLEDFSRLADVDPEYFARHPWAEAYRMESEAIVCKQK